MEGGGKPVYHNVHEKKAKSFTEYAVKGNSNIEHRERMEDEFFLRDDLFGNSTAGLFGVLDGYEGIEVAKFCSDEIPKEFLKLHKDYEGNLKKLFEVIFQKVDDQLKFLEVAKQSGTTVGLIYLQKEADATYFTSVNIGDVRAVLSRNNTAVRLSYDHKATDLREAVRVGEAKGEIKNQRVSGILPVTRALGSLELKKEGVITTPHFTRHAVEPGDKFIILASDGLWETTNDQEAVDLVAGLGNSEEMARKLMQHALNKGSSDNITIAVLQF